MLEKVRAIREGSPRHEVRSPLVRVLYRALPEPIAVS
jgi:hypothetical protein